MNVYEEVVRPVLFALSQKDPERAHILTLWIMEVAQRSPWLLGLIAERYAPLRPQPVDLCGMTFKHPLGLAAGFDKQGTVVPFLEALGFAFVEVGSVLPRPQPGNPRPRMFRLPEYRALINRMGFNSDGVEVVEGNLSHVMPKVHIPVGISLGTNKDTPRDPPSYVEDCIVTLKRIGQYADYVVTNVSSPNTQGLRDLQTADYIKEIVEGLLEHTGSKPLFVKFTCDMPHSDLIAAAEACLEIGINGFIMSNTTNGRDFSGPPPAHAGEMGGLSGPPLHARAVAGVHLLRSIDSDVPIIGVGGIEDYAGGQRMFDAGANLLQVYTSFVYQGPRVLRRIVDGVWM